MNSCLKIENFTPFLKWKIRVCSSSTSRVILLRRIFYNAFNAAKWHTNIISTYFLIKILLLDINILLFQVSLPSFWITSSFSNSTHSEYMVSQIFQKMKNYAYSIANCKNICTKNKIRWSYTSLSFFYVIFQLGSTILNRLIKVKASCSFWSDRVRYVCKIADIIKWKNYR